MFYSQFILAKKGPLGKIWLAAHLDKKLTKNQIYATDISQSVESIMTPAVPIALRLSGHLLLGVCRIYSRKVQYLYSESGDALVKMKMAQRPAAAEAKKPGKQAAPYAQITLQESSRKDELELPSNPAQMSLDDLVADTGDLDVEMGRRDTDGGAGPAGLLGQDITLQEADGGLEQFGRVDDQQEFLDVGGNEDWISFDASMGAGDQSIEVARRDDGADLGADVMMGQGDGGMLDLSGEIPDFGDGMRARESDVALDDVSGMRLSTSHDRTADGSMGNISLGGVSFDSPIIRARGRSKRRRLELDIETELRSEVIKKQLADTSDIVREFVKAPTSKRRMLEAHEAAKPLAQQMMEPSVKGLAPSLVKIFAQCAPSSLEEADDVAEDEAQREADAARMSSFGAMDMPDGGMDPSFDQPPDFSGDGTFDMSNSMQAPSMYGSHSAASLGGVADGDGDGAETATADQGKHPSGWSKRTVKMVHVLNKEFASAESNSASLVFQEMLGTEATRKTAASTFFELLVLKSTSFIDVQQDEPYDDIKITKTALFTSSGQ